MQFAVPQFTDVEDRLIGSLTLKQFLVLLGAGGIVMFLWSILGPSIAFFVMAMPFAIGGVGAALGKYNGRPLFTYIIPMAAYISSNKVMVFKREPQIISVSKTEVKTVAVRQEDLEPTESRLKKLAYLLDNKTKEEDTLIEDVIKSRAMPPPTISRLPAREVMVSKFSNMRKVMQKEAPKEALKKSVKPATVKKSHIVHERLPEIQEKPIDIPELIRSMPSMEKKNRSIKNDFDPSSIIK